MADYKLYSFLLKPLGAFGAPIAGDSFFGQLVWQFVYNEAFLNTSFDEFLVKYKSGDPAIVVSNAIPFYKDAFYFRRPSLPSSLPDKIVPEIIRQRKDNKRKNLFKVQRDLVLSPSEFFEESAVISEGFTYKQVAPHNKVNRLTFSTSGSGFDPFDSDKFYYNTEIQLAIFILLDVSQLSLESLKIAITRIGQYGYGKDASIGMGRFEISDVIELKFNNQSSDLYYTLSPLVLADSDPVEKAYYNVFTRFGKHGGLVQSNPFKNPILMFDEGAILKINKKLEKPFLGKAIEGISSSIKGAVSQGYSIVLSYLGGEVL